MSRKSKRRAARARPRPLPGSIQPGGVGVATATPARQQQPVRVGGDQALVRSVEMALGSRQPVRKSGRLVMDNVDPSIPLDRVPYFQKDLVRLGIVAAVMVVLLIAGAQLIPLLVK